MMKEAGSHTEYISQALIELRERDKQRPKMNLVFDGGVLVIELFSEISQPDDYDERDFGMVDAITSSLSCPVPVD
ncbi:hypothetical protein PFISCL1PPCAC_20168, partial [Pristionchus fissidentatus]